MRSADECRVDFFRVFLALEKFQQFARRCQQQGKRERVGDEKKLGNFGKNHEFLVLVLFETRDVFLADGICVETSER